MFTSERIYGPIKIRYSGPLKNPHINSIELRKLELNTFPNNGNISWMLTKVLNINSMYNNKIPIEKTNAITENFKAFEKPLLAK